MAAPKKPAAKADVTIPFVAEQPVTAPLRTGTASIAIAAAALKTGPASKAAKSPVPARVAVVATPSEGATAILPILAPAAPIVDAPAAPELQADRPAINPEPNAAPGGPAATKAAPAAPEPAPVAAAMPPAPAAPATVKGSYDMATAFDTTKISSAMGDMSGRAKAAFEKSSKIAEDMTEFTKGNVEAMVASGRVAAKGVEAMAQDAAETAKKNFETATTTMKSFAAVKSPTELFQLQSEYAKSAFDSAVADASKFSEAWMKLAGDIVQPLSSRYAVAVEKVKLATAA